MIQLTEEVVVLVVDALRIEDIEEIGIAGTLRVAASIGSGGVVALISGDIGTEVADAEEGDYVEDPALVVGREVIDQVKHEVEVGIERPELQWTLLTVCSIVAKDRDGVVVQYKTGREVGVVVLSYSKPCAPASTIAEVSLATKLCLAVVAPPHIERHRETPESLDKPVLAGGLKSDFPCRGGGEVLLLRGHLLGGEASRSGEQPQERKT